MEGSVVDGERTERRDIKGRKKYISTLNYFLMPKTVFVRTNNSFMGNTAGN